MTVQIKSNLTKALDEILDLVSSREPDEYIKKDIRWGHDTDCGTNEDIHKDAIKILKKYKFVKTNSKLMHECSDCGGIHPLKNKWWEYD